jgi:nitrite reductase/ring-hydroxylating ferredoxin subunit
MTSRYPFPASPNGWFSVAVAADLGPARSRRCSTWVVSCVVPRRGGHSARLRRSLSAFGSPSRRRGRVCGDGIVCPFHGWRFDGDGTLVEVPRLDRTPRVSTQAWEVCERIGQIFVWHHADGTPPTFDVIGYREDEPIGRRGAATHTESVSMSRPDREHHRQVTLLDRARYGATRAGTLRVSFTGASMVVEQRLKVTAASAMGVEVSTKTTTCGPGIAAVEVSQDPLEMLTYITQTPVDDEFTEVSLPLLDEASS